MSRAILTTTPTDPALRRGWSTGRKNGVYALGHFWVDFLCAWGMLSSGAGPAGFLWYNFCAFALQMPIGLLADRVKKCRVFALLGLALTAGAAVPVWGALLPAVLGLGNACYHVGGGRDVLLSSRKMTDLGIFVSPGALGLFLGTLAAGRGIPSWLTVAIPAVMAGLVVRYCRDARSPSAGAACRWNGFFVTFLVVGLRSLLAMGLDAPWKVGLWAAAAAVCTAGGKALGGILSDGLGWRKTAALSLVAAAVLFCLPGGAAGCGAILLFQMTMPVTLRLAADALPGMEGFAFGALTLGLFLGYLPRYYGLCVPVPAAAGMTLLSAGLLLLLREGGK